MRYVIHDQGFRNTTPDTGRCMSAALLKAEHGYTNKQLAHHLNVTPAIATRLTTNGKYPLLVLLRSIHHDLSVRPVL